MLRLASPGFEEANGLGYTLHSYNSARTTAHYVKDALSGKPIHLTVSLQHGEQTARLEALTGMVTHSIGKFAFPNVNFDLFEKQIIHILKKLA